MEQSLFKNIPTYLDLNGPILSFTSNPTDIQGQPGSNLTLTGIATATFPNVAQNDGHLAYQWYEVGVGKLSDGGRIAGSATTTLTISNLVTPDDNGRQFYVESDYVPAQYTTGNANNEPLNSGIGSITVADIIEIGNQPVPITGLTTASHQFNIVSSLSGATENLSFQWQLDGNNVSDGTLEKKTVDVISSTTVVRSVYANNGSGSFPHSITDFGGTGEYRIWSNPNLSASYWQAGATNSGGVNGITEADRILCAEQCSTATGTQVELGDFAETMNGIDWYKINVVSGINSTRITEQTFTSGSFTIPANAKDIRIDLGSGRGGSGADTHLNSGGNGGDGMGAWFSIPTSSSARTVDINVGKNGNDGLVGTDSDGGRGGITGTGGSLGGTGAISASTGLTGSGGGGGGATTVQIDGTLAIVLGGGGGGGGASESGAGTDGADAGPTSGSVPFYDLTDSDSFSDVGGATAMTDNSGAGGGGGGAGASFTYNSATYSAATAGTSGSSATGGNQGHSAYKTSLATLDGGSYNRYVKSGGAASGWAFLSYTTTTSSQTNDTKTTTISGAETSSLTLNTDKVGVGYTVGVQITGAAGNSPLTSDIVGYNVVSQFDQALINIEAIGITTSASLSTVNLNNGEVTFTSSNVRTDNTNAIRNYVLYSPERDVDVEMDMYGRVGKSGPGGGGGGEGGYSRIRLTLEKNTEYVITGLSTSIGSPALYRKGSLLVRIGQGGDAPSSSGNGGGHGGGIGISGGGGGGYIGGQGGAAYSAGNLPSNGRFGSIFQSPTLSSGDTQASAPNAGTSIACAKGIYWAQQGKTPCEDLGSVQFRLSDGSIVSNTTSTITRGYKDGYNIIETAGLGLGNGGNGGNGAIGGNGGSSSGGGGGGSGYSSGAVNVVTTTLGGSSGEARVIVRVV
jgi:hypothetical protein